MACFTSTYSLRLDFHCNTLNQTMCLRVESGGNALLCNICVFPPIKQPTSSTVTPPPPLPLTSDRMWGVRSFDGSECEQNVWNSQWSVLDRDLLKSHLLDMFPRRMHFFSGEGLQQSLCILQWQRCRIETAFLSPSVYERNWWLFHLNGADSKNGRS